MRPEVHKARAETSWLEAGTLVRFAPGLSWTEILALGKTKAWWTRAVADAEDRGFIAWDRAAKVWRLTDEGREHTRGIS